MGSPQNYYGVGFYEGRVADGQPGPGQHGLEPDGLSVAGGQWTQRRTTPSRNNDTYTTEDTNNQSQIWTNFATSAARSRTTRTLVIDGIEVRLQDARLTGSGTSTELPTPGRALMERRRHLDGRTSPARVLTTADTDPVSRQQLRPVDVDAATRRGPGTTSPNGNFRVRLTWQDGTANCAATRSVQLDQLEVRVQYHTTTTSWTTRP